MLMGLLDASGLKWIGICLVCLSLGFMKGCSYGKGVVQEEFDAYKTKIALDLADNNVAVLKMQLDAQRAQDELDNEIAKLKLQAARDRAEIKKKVNNVFPERITNTSCMYTTDELRVSQEAFDRVKSRGSAANSEDRR